MEIIIILVIALALVLILARKKGNNADEVIDDFYHDELGDDLVLDSALMRLQVYYEGEPIKPNSVLVTTNNSDYFTVKGFDRDDRQVDLKDWKMSWSCPCAVVKFQQPTGLDNIIHCDKKGDLKRSIAVKYRGGISFNFKMQFQK
jgi:hypothetical protein